MEGQKKAGEDLLNHSAEFEKQLKLVKTAFREMEEAGRELTLTEVGLKKKLHVLQDVRVTLRARETEAEDLFREKGDLGRSAAGNRSTLDPPSKKQLEGGTTPRQMHNGRHKTHHPRATCTAHR